MAYCIETENLTRLYRRGDETVRALDSVNFTVEPGEFVGIVGRSGSGKSTLMNLLGCLDNPTSGKYRLNGREVSALSQRELTALRRSTVGFIFQGFCLLPGLTAVENVELALLYRGIPAAKRRKLAEEGLRRVGLGERMYHRPAQLSGGQQQRVAVARALVGSPSLILADEPTGNLDREAGATVMALLKSLRNEGRTVVLITHDNGCAAEADRVWRMEAGKLAPV